MSPAHVDRAVRYAYHFFFRRMIRFRSSPAPGRPFTVTARERAGCWPFRGLDLLFPTAFDWFLFVSGRLDGGSLAERRWRAVPEGPPAVRRR